MRDNPEGGELDPTKGPAGTARRILLPFYPASHHKVAVRFQALV